MAINTAYLGTPGSGNAQASGATTVLSDLSISGSLDVNNVDAAGAATITGLTTTAGVTSSSIVTVTATNPLSVTTQANANDMTVGQLRIVFTSSGLSLIYSSGDSIYDVGSNTSAAQPTS
jgi:hypothetical protein